MVSPQETFSSSRPAWRLNWNDSCSTGAAISRCSGGSLGTSLRAALAVRIAAKWVLKARANSAVAVACAWCEFRYELVVILRSL